MVPFCCQFTPNLSSTCKKSYPTFECMYRHDLLSEVIVFQRLAMHLAIVATDR
jgi:hypothetical protein